MNLIIKDRGKGKTTELIFTSEATQYPIVTFNKMAAQYIKDKAKEMGCLIPEPLTIDDIKPDCFGRRQYFKNILVDEVGYFLEDALNQYFGANVVVATMTDSLKEHYDCRKKEKQYYYGKNNN